MPNLSATRTAVRFRFTNAESGEIIVQQKSPVGFPVQAVYQLRFGGSSECYGHQRLGLASREQCTTMRSGKGRYPDGDRPDITKPPPIRTFAIIQNQATENFFFDFAKIFRDDSPIRSSLFVTAKRINCSSFRLINCAVLSHFVVNLGSRL